MRFKLKYLTIERSLILLSILAHLAVAFRVSLSDTAHVVIHRFQGEDYDHTHLYPGDADHDHIVLNMLTSMSEQPHDLRIPRDNGPTKPSFVIAYAETPLSSPAVLLDLREVEPPFFHAQLPAAPYLRQPTPPPEYMA